MNEINKAKQVLREAGYYVDNLWSIDDVMDDSLTDQEKQSVLAMALTNEHIMGEIQYGISVGIDIVKKLIK
jgi:hypothetical protein